MKNNENNEINLTENNKINLTENNEINLTENNEINLTENNEINLTENNEINLTENNEINLTENNEINLTENNEINSYSYKKNMYIKELTSWILSIACAIVLSFLITKFVIVNARVPTSSMVNTININDRFIANRISYLFSDPERFDIVVFKYPDDESFLYVKRVIGLPGETVEIIDGKVYINGSTEPLRDDFLPEPMDEDKGNFGPYVVPEGHYFMLGDNRNHSEDSRFWQNKFVKKSKILGKAIFKYYPKIELLTNR